MGRTPVRQVGGVLPVFASAPGVRPTVKVCQDKPGQCQGCQGLTPAGNAPLLLRFCSSPMEALQPQPMGQKDKDFLLVLEEGTLGYMELLSNPPWGKPVKETQFHQLPLFFLKVGE